MKLCKLAVVLTLLLAGTASAQVGRTGVPFLLIAPGARAAGMGEAFIAISDDATAVHWNPAGLGKYPLTGSWLNFRAGDNDTIQSVVLVKNNLPENNYRQYDMWGLVNSRLAKWDGRKWVMGIKQELKSGQSMQNLVTRYTGLDEELAEPYVNKLARENNQIAPESIDSLRAMITPVLPDEYLYKDEIQFGFDKLLKAYYELRIDMNGFNQIRADVYEVVGNQAPSEDKLDKIAFGFDRGITAKGDRNVWMPFDLALPDTITCIGSDDENVYIGTAGALFRLEPDKLKWSMFTASGDSLPSGKITALHKFGKKSAMLVGTETGLAKFTGRNFIPFPPDANAPRGHISAISVENDRNAWVAGDDQLFHFDGFKWSNFHDEEFTIGESLPKSAERFYGELGAADLDNILAEIRNANPALGDTVAPGQTVKFPYSLGYRGNITTLGIDDRKRLWIGTTNGVANFDGEKFRLFGYRLYEAPQPITVQEIASGFIPDRNPEKIEKLSTLIREFNRLDSDQLETGKKILVYANALGSEVNAISPVSGRKTIVATDQALVMYNNGKWNRMPVAGTRGSDVAGIQAQSGELWVNGRNKVSVYSAPKKQITFMHSNYLVDLADDIYYEFFSFVYPTSDWGTFGLGVTFLSLGNQIRTDEIGRVLGNFYTYEMALTLSYGTKLMSNLYGGVSLKYINSHLSDAGAGKEQGSGSGYSVAVDGGVLYDMTRRLTLAATVTNIGPDISYIDADQADPLPRKFSFGYSFKLIDSPYNKLSFVGEATKLLVDLNDDFTTEIEEIIPHVGMEYWYSNLAGLRAGYVYDDKGVQKYMTLGASLQYSSYRFDFAYIPPTNEDYNRLGRTIRFSMNVGF
ncbi:MAG: hypothetical protein A2W25_07955 [candidate division Zixibacteria bacterium RBG_16_53_22]|nr:MAG: hypothetical protein A2W25_07955 [candidate division Zixibacteria bacterium RBG_16_53_22]